LTALLGEIAIAAFAHDQLIRPYVGDSLAVVLVYLAVRAIMPLDAVRAAISALIIAFAIEFGQKIGLIDRLGLGDCLVARLVLGTGFDLWDFLAYTCGAAVALGADIVIERIAS
jgi:hypothetical protein